MKAKRGRPRKTEIQTRDPIPDNRDPVPQIFAKPKRKRRYINVGQPCICPECGHGTRSTSGRYKDPVNKKIVEYRECIKCKEKLGAVRGMTAREVDRYCSHSGAIKDYQEDKG